MTTCIEYKPLAICVGCSKYIDGKCTAYRTPPSFFVRSGRCPINPPRIEVKKTFVNPLKASKRSIGK